jgi:hypothetical protein
MDFSRDYKMDFDRNHQSDIELSFPKRNMYDSYIDMINIVNIKYLKAKYLKYSKSDEYIHWYKPPMLYVNDVFISEDPLYIYHDQHIEKICKYIYIDITPWSNGFLNMAGPKEICYSDIIHKIPNYVQSVVNCIICFDLMFKSKILGCKHTICDNCYNSLIELERVDFYKDGQAVYGMLKSIKCPICRHSEKETFHNYIPLRHIENKTVTYLVSKLDVTCPLKCKWIGCTEQTKEHINICENRIVKCKYCNFLTTRKNYNDHKKECIDFITKCNHCNKHYIKRTKEFHDVNICDNKIITCLKCDIKYRESDEIIHIAMNCRKRLTANIDFSSIFSKY